MKNFTISLIIILCLSCFNKLYSQNNTPTTKGIPFIEIGVNNSYNYALFELSGTGSIKEFWNFENYTFTSGFSNFADIKLGVYSNKAMQLKIHMMVGYSHFQNSDSKAYNVKAVDLGWPYKSFTNSGYYFYPKDTVGESSVRLNMPQIGFGLECGVFTDRDNKSSFNFGLDILGTLITGRAHEKIGNLGETFVTIYPAFRIGAAVNVIYSYRFENWVGFNVGTKLTMPNLLGKTAEMTEQAGYMSLMDDDNEALNPMLQSKRIMGYLQLFGGISFYLGRM